MPLTRAQAAQDETSEDIEEEDYEESKEEFVQCLKQNCWLQYRSSEISVRWQGPRSGRHPERHERICLRWL